MEESISGIPVESSMAAAFVLTPKEYGHRILLLQRSGDDAYAPGSWQILYGHIEAGERAEAALVRELLEETGLRPLSLWTMNETMIFYEQIKGVMALVPLFVVFVQPGDVKLDRDEHQAFRWVLPEQAEGYFTWPVHRRGLALLKELFIANEPPALMRIIIH
ncbi:MAG: NUDIX domain-containing protein [Calditrichaeota bacterium]|nr:NUDIX domain-containing protein [Calditrichota bacterium]